MTTQDIQKELSSAGLILTKRSIQRLISSNGIKPIGKHGRVPIYRRGDCIALFSKFGAARLPEYPVGTPKVFSVNEIKGKAGR